MKQKEKDFHYRVKSFRLSDEVIESLESERKNHESWNLLFKRLLYEKKIQQKSTNNFRNELEKLREQSLPEM